MKKVLSIIFLVLALSGCGNKEEMHVTSTSFAYEKSINFKGNVYIASSSEVQNVGALIGSIKHNSDKEEESNTDNFSNYYPVGTKLYEIKDEEIKESIAVGTDGNKFIKATNIKNLK